jgi:hypothetical protein
VVLIPDVSLLGYVPGVKERRAHYRHRVDEDAELIIPSEYLTISCRVTDISQGGAGIICDVIPGAATPVRLVMKDGREFEAVTAWFENGQLGLRFVK